MKHLKPYKKSEPKIKIGEYVICTDEPSTRLSPEKIYLIKKFLSENIGKCVYLLERDVYLIQYENIPPDLIQFFNPGNTDIKPEFRGNTRIFTNNSQLYASKCKILYHSKNKKDLEIILAADKYNL